LLGSVLLVGLVGLKIEQFEFVLQLAGIVVVAVAASFVIIVEMLVCVVACFIPWGILI
jgi:hypothetical protein